MWYAQRGPYTGILDDPCIPTDQPLTTVLDAAYHTAELTGVGALHTTPAFRRPRYDALLLKRVVIRFFDRQHLDHAIHHRIHITRRTSAA